MNVYVWYGATIDELIDEYGMSAMLESVFECECECGMWMGLWLGYAPGDRFTNR